jgi:XTP/dITP diphosphohydrolase
VARPQGRTALARRRDPVKPIVLASGNAGKLRELEALLAPRGLALSAQSAFGIETPPETGDTFEANALLKARYAARIAARPALADDSGIEVDALQGRPGVYSARYAGAGASDRDNLEKLLQELQGVPPEKRSARYRGVIVLVNDTNDPAPIIAQGTWEGRIGLQPEGSGGFGYDALFVPDGSDRTAAQLTPAEKNAISHRGQALRALVARLEGLR